MRYRFLLRFDLLFWDEINKNYTSLEPDPIFKYSAFWIRLSLKLQSFMA